MQGRDWNDIELLLLLLLETKEMWNVREEFLRTLRENLPKTTVDLLVGGRAGASGAASPHVRRQLSDEGFWLTREEHVSSPAPAAARRMIDKIREEDYPAVLIGTGRGLSPWSAGYVCYMAKIPVRIGISCEFGGGVLSHCIDPPEEAAGGRERYHYLLEEAGIADLRG